MESGRDARQVFAENLKRIAVQKGKSQADIGAMLNCSASTVSDWFSGKKYPRVNRMQQLADYLGVLMSDLTMEAKNEDEISLDDFSFAFYGEIKDLTPENKEKLLEMAKFFKEQQRKEKDGK